MAWFARENYDIERFGTTVTVPNNPTATLMYYLDCIDTLIDLSDIPGIQRYLNYSNYYNMARRDKEIIVELCEILSPSIFINKCMFNIPELCGESTNRFYNIHASEVAFATVNSLIIGGVQRRVVSVMCFRQEWLTKNYINPLRAVKNELAESYNFSYTYRTLNSRNDDCNIS